MVHLLNSGIVIIVCNIVLPVVCNPDIFSSQAAIELIIQSDDGMWSSKHVHGVYTSSGAVIKVEGNLEQVHPTTLCSNRPQLTFGRIYLLKRDLHDPHPHLNGFCTSAAEQAAIAITYGATAIILITTDGEEKTIEELSGLAQPLERPIIVVRETSEEDKLLAILNGRKSVYLRISPINDDQSKTEHPPSRPATSQEDITYIGIAVIFSLILVLVAVALAVILKLRNIRRKIKIQTRGRLLENIRTYRYKPRSLRRAISSSLKMESPGPCPICLEQYNMGEEMSILPCAHEYHRKCINKWLTEHSTCPCCCGDIDELLRLETLERHTDIHKNSDNYSYCKCSGTFCSHQCSHGTSEHLLSDYKSAPRHHFNNPTYTYGNMHELLLPKDHQPYAHRQYQYLLHRLYEIKKQRPSSTTVSDTTEVVSNRLSLMSSSYSSTVDIDNSLPCENHFIGDSCQGGVPRQSDAFSICGAEIGNKSPVTEQYTSLKSLFPSVESISISPRVSDFESISSSKGRSCSACRCKRKHKMRTVRFREPESEVMSSAEEELYHCECERCRACLLRNSSTAGSSKDTSVRWSDQDSSSTNNAVETKWNIEVEEEVDV